MCSTMAGPRRGSGPAAHIIPSCRSRCRSRRCRARACSGAGRSNCSRAIEAVDDAERIVLGARHLHRRGRARRECERRGWLIRHGIQYHWFNRGYGEFRRFPRRALQPQAQGDPQGTRGGAARGSRSATLRGGEIGAGRLGGDVGLLPGHRRAQMGPALSHPRASSTSIGRADGRPAAAVPRLPRRRADRRRAQRHRAGHALRPLLGLRSRKCRSSISSSAITARSNGRSPMASTRSRPGRRASIRSRAAMSR